MRKVRNGVYWFLGIAVALRLYFVQELISAFLFFAIAFAAIPLVLVSLYMLQKGWELLLARFADSNRSAGQALTTGDPTRGIS